MFASYKFINPGYGLPEICHVTIPLEYFFCSINPFLVKDEDAQTNSETICTRAVDYVIRRKLTYCHSPVLDVFYNVGDYWRWEQELATSVTFVSLMQTHLFQFAHWKNLELNLF